MPGPSTVVRITVADLERIEEWARQRGMTAVSFPVIIHAMVDELFTGE